MARCRALDSDTPSSRPRGGRGQGRTRVDEEGLHLLYLLLFLLLVHLGFRLLFSPLCHLHFLLFLLFLPHFLDHQSLHQLHNPLLHQAEKDGHEPTPMEVFRYTHTKDHDGETFIDRHAIGVNVIMRHFSNMIFYYLCIQWRCSLTSSNCIKSLYCCFQENYSTASDRVLSCQPSSDDPLTPAITEPQTSFIPPPLDAVADTTDTLVTPPDTAANPKDTTLDSVATSSVRHCRFDFGPF
ncbi:hypothetical protein JCGZ_19539 [Jatropha curcas]|uniref:Uncharacterized protein n=1 Tax=Jatropha curcas TaxID=180498 RepID=A0A067KAY9_JATCU|nr:hypothetical protein JCGZ_19539 [Jatropha curcas]